MFDSKISINNLGPIEKATINLKNLTVFVGQNNTGKTYLLSCLYFFHVKNVIFCIYNNSEESEESEESWESGESGGPRESGEKIIFIYSK